MYERFLGDPQAVDAAWRDYFSAMGGLGSDVAHGPLRRRTGHRGRASRNGAASAATPSAEQHAADGAAKQGAVSRLIQIYANRGHLVADIDPLGLLVRPTPKVLGLDYLGLSDADLETEFFTGSRNDAIRPRLRLRDIVAQLRQIYCGKDRRRVRAILERDRASMAAGSLPGRPHAAALLARGEEAHPVGPDRRRGTGALPRHEVPGAEALLARGWRQPDSAAR